MRFLRSLSGVIFRDRIKSEKIRKQWKIEEIIDNIQNYQQKWNQHVLMMPENRLPRKALQYRPQGKDQFTQNCEWKKKNNNKRLSNIRERLPTCDYL
jgi:hypothetical protein